MPGISGKLDASMRKLSVQLHVSAGNLLDFLVKQPFSFTRKSSRLVLCFGFYRKFRKSPQKAIRKPEENPQKTYRKPSEKPAENHQKTSRKPSEKPSENLQKTIRNPSENQQNYVTTFQCERPYACDYCDYRFKLKHHKLAHENRCKKKLGVQNSPVQIQYTLFN